MSPDDIPERSRVAAMTSSVTHPHCTLFAGRAPRATCVAMVPSLAAWPRCPPTTHRQLSLRGRGATLGLVTHFTLMRVQGAEGDPFTSHREGCWLSCPQRGLRRAPHFEVFTPHTLSPPLCRGVRTTPHHQNQGGHLQPAPHGMSARGQCGVMQPPQTLIWRRDTGSYRADW